MLMIAHLLYQLLDKFKIGSDGFRKILAAIIALMLFGLLFAVVKFTKMEIPNFIRNLAILASIDLGGFAFLMWKKKDEPQKESANKEDAEGPPEPMGPGGQMGPQGQMGQPGQMPMGQPGQMQMGPQGQMPMGPPGGQSNEEEEEYYEEEIEEEPEVPDLVEQVKAENAKSSQNNES